MILNGHIVPETIAHRGRLELTPPAVVRVSGIGIGTFAPAQTYRHTWPDLTMEEWLYLRNDVLSGAEFVITTQPTRIIGENKTEIEIDRCLIMAPRAAYFQNGRFWQVDLTIHLIGTSYREIEEIPA